MSALTPQWFGDFFVLHRPGTGAAGGRVHFAHATGFNASTYRSLLSQFDPSIEVFAMDARGHGLSKARAVPQELRSWIDYADDLAAFLRTLEGPTLLAGHSMGGTVSAYVAAHYPALVAGLLLVEPVVVPQAYRFRTQLAQRLGLTRFMPMPKKAMQRTMEFSSRETAIENYVGKGPFATWPRAMIEDYIDGGTVTLDNGRVRLSCDRLWEARTFATVLPNLFTHARKISCPVTVMVGRPSASTCAPASRARLRELLPALRLVEVEGASHFLPMEYPGRVCAELNLVSEQAFRTSET